ncbi:MAG TPA: NlpC/P60 family protein [Mycobacteriales bacterium]|jgi:cell wall-associated NlpC family hydrolase|nr:NlpC/P60 family protein [Mycobacteriales bacterium]
MRTRAATRVAGVVLALAALGASAAVGVTGNGTPPAPDAAAAKVLAAARTHLGDKYVYGATGPDRWDCSGLTSVLWRTVGGASAIPRTSRQQQAWAWPLRAADARPGDLVFFGSPVTHVAFYQGNGRILDASSSKGVVVERAIWTGDVVRYGRVPRSGVPHPAPPPAPKPAPAPVAKPAPKPAPKPVAKPAPKPGAKPAPKAAPAPARTTLRPVPPPGHRPRTATTPEMARFVAALRTRIGTDWAAGESGEHGPRYDAAGLVRWAWARCGYAILPNTPAAIERLAKPVALRDLAVGDLVLYGGPAVHVGVYVGNGQMIDASKVLRTVSQRAVFASETVRFARLTPPRH